MADIFLCDVALAEIKVKGGATHLFATADEVSATSHKNISAILHTYFLFIFL